MIHKQACLKLTLTWHIAVLWKFLCSQFLHCCLYPIAWPGDVLVYRLRLIPYHTYLPKCLRRINRNIYSWLGNSFPLVYSIRKNNLYVEWFKLPDLKSSYVMILSPSSSNSSNILTTCSAFRTNQESISWIKSW